MEKQISIQTSQKKSIYTDFVNSTAKFAFFCGMPNYWHSNLDLNEKFVKIYVTISKITGLLFIFVLISQYLSWLSVPDLTPSQQSDRLLYTVAHPFFGMAIFWGFYHEDLFREITRDLMCTFRDMYHDETAEKNVVKSLKGFTRIYKIEALALIPMNGVQALMDVVNSGATFTTVAVVWPKMDDRSIMAEVARAAVFILWFLLILKLTGTYLMAITLSTCLSQQFTNLASYFRSINTIYDRNEDLEVKFEKYDKAFKYGIYMHKKTLGCVKKAQKAFGVLYTGQIVINTTVVVQTMSKVVAMDHFIISDFTTAAITIFVCLTATGLLMCNAGNITNEAAELPTAMFESGWQHCSGKAAASRVRNLVTVAMTQAQAPVVMKALYFIPMSHESFVSVCKGAYSMFSVFI